MSILFSLRRFIDVNVHRQEQEDLRRQREDWPPDVNPDDAELPPRVVAPAAPASFACRLCGHRGAEDEYCPACLAPTMERV